MKRKLNKILALLMAVLMLSAMLAACGGNDEPPAPTPAPPAPTPAPPAPPPGPGDQGWGDRESDGASTAHIPDYPGEQITLTVFTAGAGQVPSRNNKVLLELARITGVTLEWEFTPGDIDQKVGVLIADGEYADFIAPGQHRGQFLNANAYVDLDGLIQHYPNLWRHFGLYEQRLRNATLDNSIRLLDIWGRRYYINDGEDINYEPDYNGPGFYIQKDVLAWDGYSNPTTLAQYFDLLARYTAAHPTIDGLPTLPFEVFSTDWRSFSLKNPPQHLIGGRNEGDVVVDPVTLEVEIYQDKWYAKDYYQILNDAYHNDLINPETFTRTHDQFMSVIAQGRVLGVFSQHWAFGEGEQVLIADERIERTYIPLGLTFDRDEPFPYNRQTHSGIIGGNGGGISVSNQNVERTLEFLDMLLIPEVHTMLTWGIVDEDFFVTPEGRFRRTPEQKALQDDPDWRRDNQGWLIIQTFPSIEGRLPCGNAASPGDQPEEKFDNMLDYDREFYSNYFLPNGMNFSQRADFLPLFQHPGYSEIWSLLSTMDSEAPERQTFDAITEAQMRYLPGIIMTAPGGFDAAWERYINENYVPIADEIAALERWIHLGILAEIEAGVYA